MKIRRSPKNQEKLWRHLGAVLKRLAEKPSGGTLPAEGSPKPKVGRLP